ncbi:hypothetical protein [Mesorhizobium sp.]|uniref:hypothetical protein n=1 Tax=Mesorhizobium sp. TaxID=1871066 RepID=UPI00257ADE47|nr:hypothetical protein [Mesorhizobium sp.]
MGGTLATLRGLLFKVGALRPFQRDVAIAWLRHDSRQVHLQEGYGGQPIERFPPYEFFRRYTFGDVDGAKAAFRAWYVEQFRKYQGVSKAKGGLHNGSLYRQVVVEHQRAGMVLAAKQPVFQQDLVERAIDQRVDERFAFFASVKDRGYQPEASDPVFGVLHDDDDDTVHLMGGHHRAAAVLALGHETLSRVTVLTPRTRALFSRLRIVR